MTRTARLALLALALAVPAAAAPRLAEYRVRLTLKGVWGPYNFEGCPARPGAEVLEGTVRGDEADLADNGEVEYSGVVDRTTNVPVCDVKPAPTEDQVDYCVTQLTGSSKVQLAIKIAADREGAWIQWEPMPATVKASAAGDCEAEVAKGVKDIYTNEGDNAEIPSVRRGRLVEGKTYTDQGPTYSTTLEVLDALGLRAVPKGPGTVDRAATVTLDGSHSTAAKGHPIQSYEWDLTPLGSPDGCAGIGAPTHLSGVSVTFVALCSLEAKLTVRDDRGEEDDDTATVTIRPRDWKTQLTTSGTINRQNFTFVANGFVFGYNRCDRSGHFDEENNHWYEPQPGSRDEFENGSFWIDQVRDSGPFAGIYFVSRGDFEIQRAVWVNKRLSKGGDVFDLNPGSRQVRNCTKASPKCPFGAPVLDRLRRSVEAHEQLHSTLAARAIAGKKDPAKGAESSLEKNRQKLHDAVNLLFTTARSDMTLASSEANVKAALRGGEFGPGGCIDFPDWDGAIRGCYFHFPSFADKGERDMPP